MPARALLVTADDDLLDSLLALAMAAGVEPDVARDGVAAAATWASAPLVVVDERLVTACLTARLPRRDRLLVVVPPGRDDPRVWPAALQLGAEQVVSLPEGESWVSGWLADARVEASRARVLSVVGSCGGAGVSTLAAALAVTAVRRELDVVLVDADPWGGGIDLLLGAESSVGVRWHDLAETAGRVSRESLVPALPCADGLPVLAWARPGGPAVPLEAFRSVLDGVARGGDLVVVDVGRCSPYAETVLPRSDTVLLLAMARLRSVAGAGAVLAATSPDHDVQLLVRGGGRGGLDALDIADALGLPLRGTVPHDARRTEEEELGLPPAAAARGALARLCAGLLLPEPARRAA